MLYLTSEMALSVNSVFMTKISKTARMGGLSLNDGTGKVGKMVRINLRQMVTGNEHVEARQRHFLCK